jgi:hypothetical protein
MILSYCAQHFHNFPPQYFMYQLPWYRNKIKWCPFFCRVFSSMPLSSSLLLTFLPIYLCCSFLPIAILPPLLSLTSTNDPKVFSSLSHDLHLSLFCYFLFNKETPKNNIPSTYQPAQNWKGFKIELTLKVVKSPLPTLIANDYLPWHSAYIPKASPIYFS